MKKNSSFRNDSQESEMVVASIKVVSYSLRVPPTGRLDLPVPMLAEFISSIGLDQIGINAPHFVYTIRVQVSTPILQTWEVHKRFSDLAKLDDSLSTLSTCLPYFPPRGARRDLGDACALERQRLLNEYFEILIKLTAVVHTHEFMSFFEFERFESFVPNKIAEVICSDDCVISDIATSFSLLAVAVSSVTTVADRLLSYGWKRPQYSELIVFRKLPNCFLFERMHVEKFAVFRISLVQLVDDNIAVFATSDRRIGITRLATSETVFVQCGAIVTAMTVGENTVWAGDVDGVIHTLNLATNTIDVRMNSNCLAIVTALTKSGSLLYVGFSNGIVSVFQIASSAAVLVTILQGPESAVASLVMVNTVLCAAHTDGTVQFWDVVDVLSSGTRQLSPWGPAAAPIVGMAVDAQLVVCLANGVVNIIEADKTNIMFRTKRQTQPCLALGWGVVCVGGGLGVEIWKPRNADLDLIDVSTLELCQSVPRVRAHSWRRQEETDDLDSWAKT